jgi:hypothetical protein
MILKTNQIGSCDDDCYFNPGCYEAFCPFEYDGCPILGQVNGEQEYKMIKVEKVMTVDDACDFLKKHGY